MAVADMNVKVGADISELLSKVDAAKAKLNQLTETQGVLKERVSALNASLKESGKAFDDVQRRINQANISIKKGGEEFAQYTREGRAAYSALKSELETTGNSYNAIKQELLSTETALANTTAQIKTQSIAVKEASVITGGGFSKSLTTAYSGLRKLAYIIPGMGIAGLISLISGPLIDAFSDWYDSIDKVSNAQILLKANLQNYNDINEEANKNASKQITSLKILYEAATNVNLSMKERLAAVKGLQNEFPDYFKNINQETILNGGAKSAYDALTDSIIRNARAKAAISKLEELGAKQLDNDIQKQKILNATANEAAKAQDRVLKSQTSGSSLTGGGAGGQTVTITREEQLKAIAARRDSALKTVEQNNIDLKNQEDFIKKFIGLSDLAKAAETEIKPPKVSKDEKSLKDVETISDVLQKLVIQIDFLNQKEIVLKTSQANQKVQAIESTINTLMQKFKLLADNPIIISLETQINGIQGDQFLKGLTKEFKPNNLDKLVIPYELQLKPEDSNYHAFDADSYNIREILKKLGVSKTKIGIPIDTANITELRQTLTDTQKRLEDTSKLITNTLSPAFDALFTGILEGSQNAFQSFGQALEQTIVQLGVAVLKAAAFAAILSALGMGEAGGFSATFQKLLGLSKGGPVQSLSTGGPVWGAGTATSDSIPARLSKGEYVIKAAKVQEFGLDFFNKINFGNANIKDILKDNFGLMKFGTGGFVSPNSINISRPASVSNLAIGEGQHIEITGNFELRNDRLVAAVSRGKARINRNS